VQPCRDRVSQRAHLCRLASRVDAAKAVHTPKVLLK
jgi:hypothetical protein